MAWEDRAVKVKQATAGSVLRTRDEGTDVAAGNINKPYRNRTPH